MKKPELSYPEALRVLNKAVYDALRAPGAPTDRQHPDRVFMLELATKTDKMVDDVAGKG